MAARALLCLVSCAVAVAQPADVTAENTQSLWQRLVSANVEMEKVSTPFKQSYKTEDAKTNVVAKDGLAVAKESKTTAGNFLTYSDAQLKKMHLKNHYIPGVNGVVFETPAPGDDRAQSYVDTGKAAVILGFVFMGVVILICWMECKTFCKTVEVFGH